VKMRLSPRGRCRIDGGSNIPALLFWQSSDLFAKVLGKTNP
jgi:hypothetical protein